MPGFPSPPALCSGEAPAVTGTHRDADLTPAPRIGDNYTHPWNVSPLPPVNRFLSVWDPGAARGGCADSRRARLATRDGAGFKPTHLAFYSCWAWCDSSEVRSP